MGGVEPIWSDIIRCDCSSVNTGLIFSMRRLELDIWWFHRDKNSLWLARCVLDAGSWWLLSNSFFANPLEFVCVVEVLDGPWSKLGNQYVSSLCRVTHRGSPFSGNTTRTVAISSRLTLVFVSSKVTSLILVVSTNPFSLTALVVDPARNSVIFFQFHYGHVSIIRL